MGVVLVGLVTFQLVGSGVLALMAAWSSAEPIAPGRVLANGLAYLPAELVVGAAALALFGALPRALPLAWAGAPDQDGERPMLVTGVPGPTVPNNAQVGRQKDGVRTGAAASTATMHGSSLVCVPPP